MNTQETRKSLLKKASHSKTLTARVAPAVRAVPQPKLLTASQRIDLVDAIRLNKEGAAPFVPIDKVPGFSPMQLRQHIDKLGGIHDELETVKAEATAVLARIKGLEKDEKAGLELMKKAIKEMDQKGRLVAEGKKALLQFTAYSKHQVPGIEQMIANPDDAKWGEKAGDLFGRIAAKLGKDIGDAVEQMYSECAEDLTHQVTAIKGLKIVMKTSSISPAIIKKAGLTDVVVGIKEWLTGKIDPVAKRLLNFVGDIGRWVKGFVERTKRVGKAKDSLLKALTTAEKDTDKLVKDYA
jgi:hypothetical protein